MSQTQTHSSSFTSVNLFRRLMAIFYDFILLTAILLFAFALVNAINAGKAVDQNSPYNIFSSIYMASIIIIYFGWFWTHGGQTLGMQTWKIKLISNISQAVTWRQALIREFTACVSWLFLGLGFIWSVFDIQKRSWHDITSSTTLIDLRKTEKE